MPGTQAFLYAVQDARGREVCSWKGEVRKVSEVSAHRESGQVHLLRHGAVVASGADPGGLLELHRWTADDKQGTPTTHKIR